MSLGLSGSHRTGKSTLARAFAEYEGIPFVQTTASAVFKAMGVSPSETLPMGKRLEVQRRILDEFDRLYSNAGAQLFVTDRTPIDLMAYTMVEIGQAMLTPKDERALYDYTDDCMQVLNRHFSTVVLVSPAIPLIAEEGKASLSRPFIDHLALVIEGLCLMPQVAPKVYRIPRFQVDIADRVESLCSIVEKRAVEHAAKMKLTEEYTGQPVIYH